MIRLILCSIPILIGCSTRKQLAFPLKNGYITVNSAKSIIRCKPTPVFIHATGGSIVTAVEKGKVLSIFTIEERPVILVKGKYFIVYSDFDTIYVKRNQLIRKRQPLGRIKDNDTDESGLDILVMKDRTALPLDSIYSSHVIYK